MYTLLKNPTFLLFFLGNIISLIGFGFNLIAISWLVLEKTNSEFALGKIMASATAPGLVLALFAGIIIDKVNRKWLLVVLDIFRMFVVIGFLFAMNYYEFQLWLLYPVAILVGLGNSLHRLLYRSLLMKKTTLMQINYFLPVTRLAQF